VRSTRSSRSTDSQRSQSSRESQCTYQTEPSNRHEIHNINTNQPKEPHGLDGVAHQEMDYRPELVISILQSTATKHMKIVRALVDTGSSRTIVRTQVLPSWVLSKASEDEACTYSTLSGFQTNRQT
jgi:hypothetical protein